MQYSNTKLEVKTFLLQHFDGIILADDWICRKHVLEAQQHYSVPGFTPKWCNKLSQQPSKEKCSNPSCTNTQYPKLIKPAFASIDKIKSTWNHKKQLVRAAYLHCVTHAIAKCTTCSILKRFVDHVEQYPRQVYLLAVTVQMRQL